MSVLTLKKVEGVGMCEKIHEVDWKETLEGPNFSFNQQFSLIYCKKICPAFGKSKLQNINECQMRWRVGVVD